MQCPQPKKTAGTFRPLERGVYRFLGHVGDVPGTDDLHRWVVADHGRTPSLVTHERIASHGPNAEGLPGDPQAGSLHPVPASAGQRPTTRPRKDSNHGRHQHAYGGDGQRVVVNGQPIQQIFHYTQRLAFA